MYEIYIYKETKPKFYKELIDFAFKKSDALMLVDFKPNDDEKKHSISSKEALGMSEREYRKYFKHIEEYNAEIEKDKEIYKSHTLPFLNKIEPYRISSRDTPTEWPSSECYTQTEIVINTYRVCDQLKKFIVEAGGIFKWNYPYYPLDLCFFKNSYCWFVNTAHEGYAHIYVETMEEVEELKKLKMKIQIKKLTEGQYKLFYEPYDLK